MAVFLPINVNFVLFVRRPRLCVKANASILRILGPPAASSIVTDCPIIIALAIKVRLKSRGPCNTSCAVATRISAGRRSSNPAFWLIGGRINPRTFGCCTLQHALSKRPIWYTAPGKQPRRQSRSYSLGVEQPCTRNREGMYTTRTGLSERTCGGWRGSLEDEAREFPFRVRHFQRRTLQT